MQDTTPRNRVAAAVQRYGRRAFVQGCVAVLRGAEMDVQLLEVLGGSSTRAVLAGQEGGVEGHWPRVWALRAFLYAWDESAEPAVLEAGDDPHWRVREMAAKVIRVREFTSAESERLLQRLTDDPNHRVRAAASKALQ